VRVSSFAEALTQCQNEEEVFIIGGEQVYKEAINRAEKLYLTEIDAMPERADAFFPDYQDWHRIYYETHKKGEYNPFTFAFTVYQKPILCL
jgi:dihydrofolate reductase